MKKGMKSLKSTTPREELVRALQHAWDDCAPDIFDAMDDEGESMVLDRESVIDVAVDNLFTDKLSPEAKTLYKSLGCDAVTKLGHEAFPYAKYSR